MSPATTEVAHEMGYSILNRGLLSDGLGLMFRNLVCEHICQFSNFLLSKYFGRHWHLPKDTKGAVKGRFEMIILGLTY